MFSKFRVPEVILGVYLTIAIFALGFVFGGLPHSGQAAEQKSWWTDATADFTLGLVLVGVIQAGLFYFQLRLIRESLGLRKRRPKLPSSTPKP